MSGLRFGPPRRQLEGVVSRPAGPSRGGAVVCHPHPQMGGDMENPVVLAVGEALSEAGLVVVRFNFGGVGRSEGAYSGGPAEVEDVAHALAALRAVHAGARVDQAIAVAPPLAFLDWDFLPALELPIVFVAGDRDPYCPSRRLAASAGSQRRLEVIPGADHFFAGAEEALRHAVARAVRPADRAPARAGS